MGGGVALTTHTGGARRLDTNKVHGWGGGGLALTRHPPEVVCAWYNPTRSFRDTLMLALLALETAPTPSHSLPSPAIGQFCRFKALIVAAFLQLDLATMGPKMAENNLKPFVTAPQVIE